jgi:2-iminoacetate synthase ThiH
VRLIREAGRIPVERDTLYRVVREHAREALPEAAFKVRDRKADKHLVLV